MKTLNVIIEKTNTGYSGYVEGEDFISGSTGDTLAEVMEDAKEGLKELEVEFDDLEFSIDIQQFFEHYRVLNKTAFAEMIGISPSNLRGYVAKSKGAYLSINKIKEISDGINRLGKELSSISLIR